jgi:hypothetical protein
MAPQSRQSLIHRSAPARPESRRGRCGRGDAEIVGVELGEHGPGGFDQAPLAGQPDHRHRARQPDAEGCRNSAAGNAAGER